MTLSDGASVDMEEAKRSADTKRPEPATLFGAEGSWEEDSAILDWKLQQAETTQDVKQEALQIGDLKPVLLQPNLCYNSLWRDWEDVSPQETPSEGQFNFLLLSYNILSQDLITENPHLYLHCPPEILAWEYRWPNLLKELQHWGADVLCLQEVQEDHYRAQVQPSLSALGYSCHYKRRTGRKTDGCASCFKTSRFRLLQESYVEFFRPGINVLNRDNVGLILLLQPIASEDGTNGPAHPALCVANTHLLYNPRRGDIKLAQLAVLLAEVDRISRTPGGPRCPIILCGDLNSTPHSPLYRLLHNGFLDCSGLSSWEVSGQEQDCSFLYPRLLLLPLWPDYLGIDGQCQYKSLRASAVEDRRTYSRWHLLELRYCDPALQRPPDLPLIKGVTDNQPDPNAAAAQAGLFPDPLAPPHRMPHYLQHFLQLTSAYHHFLPAKGCYEVTTFPLGIGSTVDYIFYSAEPLPLPPRNHDLRFFQDGALKLRGRLSLLSEDDLRAASGLPNTLCSSDHLFLLTRFSLDPVSR
ncbi:protein angel homolog 1 [Gastrophryne carolinensis]